MAIHCLQQFSVFTIYYTLNEVLNFKYMSETLIIGLVLRVIVIIISDVGVKGVFDIIRSKDNVKPI